jgi:activator of HSP90 ATPase
MMNDKNMSTRRQLTGSALALGALAMAGARRGMGAIMPCRAIHQEEDFKASPRRIYEALLDAKQFSAFSGGRQAEIGRETGGAFSIFAGHIVGRNLELAANQRIVQAWRVVPWPEGVHSIARFELKGVGSGTRVILDHTGFPSELAEHLASGWQENYWIPLRKYLG